MINWEKLEESLLANKQVQSLLEDIKEAFQIVLDYCKEIDEKIFIYKSISIKARYINKFLISYKIKRLLFHRSKATYK